MASESARSRRSFLELLIRGGLGAGFLSLVAPALAYVWPVTQKGSTSSTVEVGKLEEFPVWGSRKVAVNGRPVILVRTPQKVTALSAVCTHLGCIVRWDDRKRRIACPCHAGFFDETGRVVSGPPPRPLAEYEVRVVDGKILVQG